MCFSKITFGFASAEVESSEYPELLLRAFLDPHHTVEELRTGRKFLVLGPKGSGKSAAGLHLSLVAKLQPNLFVKTYFLADLSYRRLGEIARADLEEELVYPRAWGWILLLCLISSLSSDEGAMPEDTRTYSRTMEALRKKGLIPAKDLGDLVGRSSISDLELKVFDFGVSGRRDAQKEDIPLAVLSQQLRELLATTKTESRHIIVIDGLDDVLLGDNVQLKALSGLLLESSRLNQYFREKDLPFKVVVLCRTDIYERLPGPNQNKIRQDLGIELSWYHEGGPPSRSNLVRLANLRAQFFDPRVKNIFSEFFPKKVGPAGTVRYLLEHTRHTPRDFLQLLNYIQKATGQDQMDYYHVRAGLRSYADSYFLPEIKDELQGAVSPSDTAVFLERARRLRKKQFGIQEISEVMPRGFGDDKLEEVLSAFYAIGAIGNCFARGEGRSHYTFRFRNRSSEFNPFEDIALHRGLARSLAIS